MSRPVKLQPLRPGDAQYTNHGDLRQRFNKVADGGHVLHVIRDQGVYRHLRFAKPGTGMYRFDLITWPGHLMITGDMGTYTFSRVRDMFTFFHGYINTDYWAEKLQHGAGGGRESVKTHDREIFRAWALRDFWTCSRELEPQATRAWWQSLRSEVLDDYSGADLDSHHGCLDALRDVDAPAYHYQDDWEQDWSRYDWHFEFCLAAIVTGIRTYNQYRAEQRRDRRRREVRGARGVRPTRHQARVLAERGR